MRDAARLVSEALIEIDSGVRSTGDWMVLSAIERQLAIVGEAVKRLTLEFRDVNPAINWRK